MNSLPITQLQKEKNGHWYIKLCTILLMCLTWQFAGATTFNVTNTNFSGSGSLAEAVTQANADGSATKQNPHIIKFCVSGTFSLNYPRRHTIFQGHEDLSISFTSVYYNIGVSLTGIHITFNNIKWQNQAGGSFGGAVMSSTGRATLHFNNCYFKGNSAQHQAGGIFNNGDSIVINRCTFENNITTDAGGQGGAALFNNGGYMKIENSTFIGNNSASTQASGGGGAVKSHANGTTIINNCTFYNNTSAGFGGGVANSGGGVCRLNNCIVVGNTGATGPDLSGTFISDFGGNITGSTAGATLTGTTTGNVTGVSASSVINTTLTDNGHFIPTLALVAGSPAINAAINGAPTTDQREYTRNGAPDAGAFEFNGVNPCAGFSVSINEFTIGCAPAYNTYSFTATGSTAPLRAWWKMNSVFACGETTTFFGSVTAIVTVSDEAHCIMKDTFVVSYPATPVINRTYTICTGGSLTVGGSTFTQAGNYAIPFGCDSVVNATVVINNYVTPTVTISQPLGVGTDVAVPMSIGASASSTYPSNSPAHAFDGDTVTNGWGSPSSSNPEWLQFDYGTGNGKVVNGYRIYNSSSMVGGWGSESYNPRAWTFEAWSGSAWVVLQTITNGNLTQNQWSTFNFANTVAYEKYRIYITSTEGSGYKMLSELYFLGPNNPAPQANLSALPGPSSSGDYNTSNTAPMAFDDDTINNGWLSISSSPLPAWLEYNFTPANPKVITGYSILNRSTQNGGNWNNNAYNPTSWQFQGWNGSAWVILDIVTNGQLVMNQKKTFSFYNTTPYERYRIYITAAGTSITRIQEMEMYETQQAPCGNRVYKAVAVNSGSNPFYQWKVNGVNTGTNAQQVTLNTVNHNDVITCAVTANNVCQTSATAVSNALTFTTINSTIYDTVCGSYLFNGISRTVSGIYYDTLTAANGCDSFIVLNLTMLAPAIAETRTNVSCNGGSNGLINLTATGSTLPYTYLWSNGATTEDLNTLPAGAYTVTVTGANGCPATRTISITQPAQPLTLSETHVNVNCFGGSTGSINLTAAGGTSPYTYNWGGGITTQNRTGLAANTYTVTVTDANLCTATLSVNVTHLSTALATSVTQVNVACFGGNTGSIDLTVTGGTTPYTYNWSGGVTTQDRFSLTAGNYFVTVTDANGCTATRTVSIIQPSQPLSTSATQTNVSCNGGSNGSINLSVIGGNFPYTYLWSNGATTEDISFLAPGNYVVTVTSAGGCTSTRAIFITQPSTPLTTSATQVNVACFGGNTGSINVAASGGTPSYTYNWGGITSQNRTNLTANTYTVTVTDANNCTASRSVTITQPATALTTSATQVNVACFGGNTGSINLTASGGTPFYTYNWGGGITSQNRTNLTANTYTVTVTDANSCTASRSVTITQPATALATSASQVNVACFSGNTGWINLTASGGTPSYTYNWGGGITTQNRTNLTANTYTVTVTDANSCTASRSVTITQPATALDASATRVDVCFSGGNTGSIDLTVTGGTPSYTYNWGGGVTTQDRVSLTAGTYTVTVTDANGCSVIRSVTITQPSQPLSTLATQTNVSCNGGSNGSINLSVSGGTFSYSYLWSNGATTEDISSLTSGSYTVTVTAIGGCTATRTVSVTQPSAALAASATQVNVACFGGSTGSINLTASGGTPSYTYNWGGGITTQNRTNLTANTYNVTVTDANSCTASRSVTITGPAAALNYTATPAPASAFGVSDGSINFSATGGTPPFTYSINGGGSFQSSATFSNLAAGSYNVRVRDANNCLSSVQTVNITQPPNPFSVISITCYGNNDGQIQFTPPANAQAPYTISISGPVSASQLLSTSASYSFTGLPAGTYTCTMQNGFGVIITTSSLTIYQPSQLNMYSSSSMPSSLGANDGYIYIYPTGGTSPYTYSIDSGLTYQSSSIVYNLAPGTYHVRVKDNNNCLSNIEALYLAEPLGSSVVPLNGFCYGDAALEVSFPGGQAPYEIYLSGYYSGMSMHITGITGNTYTFTGLGEDYYDVQVVDSFSTSESHTFVYLSSAQPVYTSIYNNPVSAIGASDGYINVYAYNGSYPYTYSMDSGLTYQSSTDFYNLTAGTYYVIAKDANNCKSAVTETIVRSPLSATVNVTNATCNGPNDFVFELDIAGGAPPYNIYYYSYSSGASQYISGATDTAYTFTGLAQGQYYMYVSDGYTSQYLYPSAELVSVYAYTTHVSAFGNSDGSIQLTGQYGIPPYIYSLDSGLTYTTSNTFSNLAAGTYYARVKDANNCESVIREEIVRNPLAASVAVSNATCSGSYDYAFEVNLAGGVPPYTISFYGYTSGSYQYISGITASSYTFSGLGGGGYSMAISDAYSTQYLYPYALSISAYPSVTHVSTIGATDGTIELIGQNGTLPYSYSLDSGLTYGTSNTFSNLSPGIYYGRVKDANNCETSLMTIYVSEPLGLATTVTNAACNGANDWQIQVNLPGGEAPYNVYLYAYNSGTYTSISVTNANSYTFTNLSEGDYYIDVTDALSGYEGQFVNIYPPANPVSFTAAAADVLCGSVNTGQITVTATDGLAPYTYSKDDGITYQASNIFSGLAAGTYPIKVKDANSCETATQSVAINSPTSGVTFFVSTLNVTCYGVSNGNLDVNTVSGGTAPYTYSIDNGITYVPGNVFSSLPAGTYQVKVKDANNCQTNTTPVTITEPAELVVSANATNVSCNNGYNGSVNLTVSGGTPAYLFAWSNGENTEDINNLTFGYYNFTVTDNLGCSVTQQILVDEPAPLTATATNGGPYLVGQTAVFTSSPAGGTAPYTYNWSEIVNGSLSSILDQNPAISNVQQANAGLYNVTVVDANGCTATANTTLNISGGGGPVTRTWNGGTNNWHTPTNWTPVGVPSLVDSIVIPATVNVPIISASASAKSIRFNAPNTTIVVNAGVTLGIYGHLSGNTGAKIIGDGTAEIAAANNRLTGNLSVHNLKVSNNFTLVNTAATALSITNSLEINGAVLTTSGKLFIKSTASGAASIRPILSGSIVGNVTQERYIGPGNLAYEYLASGVSGQTIGHMNDDISIRVGAGASVLWYNETLAGNVTSNGWTGFTALANPIPAHRGVAAYMYARPRTVDFTGPAYQGNQNITVNYTNNGSAVDDGYNLVANPYISDIDWDAPTGWTRTNIDPTIYILNPATNNNVSYNYITNLGTGGFNGKIANGQSFFVQATAASPVLQVTEQVKTSGAVFYKQDEQSTDYLRLSLNGQNGNGDEMILGFADNATETFDRSLDAAKLPNNFVDMGMVTKAGEKLSQQFISSATDNAVIPVELNTNNETGTFTFNFDNTSALSKQVYLRDNLLNEMVNVNTANAYTFEVNQQNIGNTATRFDLVIGNTNTEQVTPAMEMMVYPNPANASFTIAISGMQHAGTIYMYDLVGKLVYSQTEVSSNRYLINTDELHSGVYFVEVSDGVNKKVERITINK